MRITNASAKREKGVFTGNPVERKARMVDFILKYWIQELFALIVMVITWMVKKMIKRQKESNLQKEAMLALLHDRLYHACSFYIAQGWCSVNDRENLECLYKPYKDLGGNGTGECLYNKCMALPIGEKEVCG